LDSPPSPWLDVVASFEKLSAEHQQFAALRDLARRIASSGYASSLHPWTSMHTLCISQVDSPTRHLAPRLAISVLGEELEFRYVDTAVQERQWRRVVPSAAGFNRFVSFLDQLNWFGGAHRAADS
jgi:hypothetical protein